MSTLPAQFSIPVSAWAWASPDATDARELDFIAPLLRRRLSSLSRATLAAAQRCLGPRGAARVIFSSRHGELRRSTQILESLCAQEPVSPTAFSLSVLNAMTGVLGIARADRSTATALSSGPQSLGYALIEAYLQYRSDCAAPVLVVHGDEPVPAIFGTTDSNASEAIALLVSDDARARLEFSMTPRAQARITRFDTQAQAVRHALSGGHDAAWSGTDACDQAWQWRCIDVA